MADVESHLKVIAVEPTPNPSTLKFCLDGMLSEKIANFASLESAQHTPIARALFEVPHVANVMMGRNFVSVSKTSEGDWYAVGPETEWMSLGERIVHVIQIHLDQGQTAVTVDETSQLPGGDEIAEKIRAVIDTEVRPAVAMDGGDIVFDHFAQGVVYVHMRGACSGCPSSTMTLRVGIENRLKEEFPQVQAVMAL